MEYPTLNIGNICNGAVPEVFGKAVHELMKNIKDPNTIADAVRTLSVEFKFSPFADRSGAEVIFSVKTKLSSIAPVTGTVFISQTQHGLNAYAKDPRQDALFTEASVGNA